MGEVTAGVVVAEKDYLLRSMTGYGEAKAEIGAYMVMVNVRAVNSRYFDFRFKAPAVLGYLEPAARKLGQQFFQRGKIDLNILLNVNDAAAEQPVQANVALAKGYYQALLKLRQELGLPGGEIPLSLIVSQREVLQHTPELETLRAEREQYLAVIQQSLLAVRTMQVEEGENLKISLLAMIKHLEVLIEEIASQVIDLPTVIRDRLFAKMQSLLAGIEPFDENRLYQEAAMQAEKADVTEELVRFRSHCQQFCQTVERQTGARGKKLDFIIQELLREANTIGSKVSCLPVVQTVILIKNELEKLREQVQNVA